MNILDFHLQPQFKHELFYIYTSHHLNTSCIELIWLDGFTTGVCGGFLLLTWWMVAEFHGWWRRQDIVEMKCTVICCEIQAECWGIGSFSWSTQESLGVVVLVPTWLHLSWHLKMMVGFHILDPRQGAFLTWSPGLRGGKSVADFLSCRSSDWLSAGLNIAWHLGGCMLWVCVHVGHEKRGVCSLFIYPSGAMLARGWFLQAGLSCNAGA